MLKPNNSYTAKLSALWLATLLWTSPVIADDFWAHRVAKQVDVKYGEDNLQSMDVFTHGSRTGEPNYFKADKKPRPTLMWIHGGGWLGGDKASQISQLIPYLERGWNVFNVNYRQGAGTAPQAVDDVMCAYKFISEKLAEAGQPTDQIVVSGASAGGHLSLAVGLLNTTGTHPCKTSTPPQSVVNWYGITDIEMVDEYLNTRDANRNYARAWAGTAQKIAEVSAAYSPLYLISDQAPPIISIHGTNDTVVPYEQGEALHASLNTPNELVTLAGGTHGGFTDAQHIEAFTRIFAFIDAH